MTLSAFRGGSGTIFVKVQHRLESRVCLLDGTVLYSRKEELEAFDAAIDTDGKFVLAVSTSNINLVSRWNKSPYSKVFDLDFNETNPVSVRYIIIQKNAR